MSSASRASSSTLRTIVRALCALVLVLPAAPAALLAQPAGPRAPGDWSVGVQATWRTASTGLDDALLRAGFEWGMSGFLGGDSGPSDPQSSVLVAVRVGVLNGVVVSGLFDASRSLIDATGWKGLSSLGIEPRLGLTAAVVSVETRNRLRLGLGPALYRISTTVESLSLGSARTTETLEESQVGLLLEAGIELPPTRRLFLDASLQYRWAPDVTVGPIGDLGFPATDLSLAHWSFGIGVGIRP